MTWMPYAELSVVKRAHGGSFGQLLHLVREVDDEEVSSRARACSGTTVERVVVDHDPASRMSGADVCGLQRIPGLAWRRDPWSRGNIWWSVLLCMERCQNRDAVPGHDELSGLDPIEDVSVVVLSSRCGIEVATPLTVALAYTYVAIRSQTNAYEGPDDDEVVVRICWNQGPPI